MLCAPFLISSFFLLTYITGDLAPILYFRWSGAGVSKLQLMGQIWPAAYFYVTDRQRMDFTFLDTENKKNSILWHMKSI